MQSTSMAWNSFLPLPPPGSRTHAAPHSGMTAHVGHHHPGTGAAVTHPVTVAQQQQREREEREREARERDAREQRQRETENLGMREHHLAAAAERLHRQAEARDHVAAQQRAAYYAATAPPTQQVKSQRKLERIKCFLSLSFPLSSSVLALFLFVEMYNSMLTTTVFFFYLISRRCLDPRACLAKSITHHRQRTREPRSRRFPSVVFTRNRLWSGHRTALCRRWNLTLACSVIRRISHSHRICTTSK